MKTLQELAWDARVFARRVRHSRSKLGTLRGALFWMQYGGRSDDVHQVRWPGYEHPILLRPRHDAWTFEHIIVRNGYELPYQASPRTIIDAGANIGLSSLWFARRYPAARIVALEPDADNFELLVENTRRYTGVEPVHGALWGEVGTVALDDPGGGADAYRVAQVASSHRGPPLAEVPALTVDAVMEAHALDRVDLLKIDIEGAEIEVFTKPWNWIGKVDVMAIELHDRFRPGCSRRFFSAIDGHFGDEVIIGEDTFVRRLTVGLPAPAEPIN